MDRYRSTRHLNRDNHAMMLDQYSQTKDLLFSYSTEPFDRF